MRLLVISAAALAFGLVVMLTSPSAVAACTAEWPAFQEVLEGSGTIVVGSVSTGVSTDADPHPERFIIWVERLLRGRADATIDVTRQAYLCGDGLGAEDIGQRVIIASDMRYYSAIIAPFWWADGDGELSGWAETPAGVTTLDELAALIAAMPDTSTDGPRERTEGIDAWWLVLAGALSAALLLLARPPWTPRRSRG